VKRKVRNKETSRKYKMYVVKDGKIVEKRRCCPRCGEGIFMAEHKDRFTCGTCHFTIFKEKK